jgi:hypothetical protein
MLNYNSPILCNGGMIYMTRNAIDAVGNFKKAFTEQGKTFGNTISLRVDAICINQEDLDERAE